jgi:8-oxo-dGTP diphosphatase
LRGIQRLVDRIINKVLKIYWKVFRPRTFGVKALILHPSVPGLCVMIRHSYADQERWALPGGGYRQKKESAEDAIRRECMEELGIKLSSAVVVLKELVTEREGKRDHLTIFSGTALSAELRPNREIAEVRWTPLDYSGLPNGCLVSQWANIAIAAHRDTEA